MADTFMIGSIAVAAANVFFAATLMAVYGSMYSKTRAPFSAALLVFAAAFLAHNALVVYSYVTMMPSVPEAMNPYLFGIGALEAAGLGAMVWTATR
jgi:hypothetical protein